MQEINWNTEIIWKDISKEEKQEELIKKVIQKCFEIERISPNLFYICVTLTNPKNIQKLNKQYRKVDSATDVLSFPMYEKQDLDKLIEAQSAEKSTETTMEQDILGDIIISIEQVQKQAEEYGHSFERELAYMLVHGFYHLRGYDHITEEEKAVMRQKEENVLSSLNITR